MSARASVFRDRVAIASASTTGFRREWRGTTRAALAIDACKAAITDAGIDRREINGIIGEDFTYVQSALGIPRLTYWSEPDIPFVSTLVNAANAVHAGAADVVLAYHSVYRTGLPRRSPDDDPFRTAATPVGANVVPPDSYETGDGFGPDKVTGAVAYTAWASRYLHEYGATRDAFGYRAVNGRSHAAGNPGAALRDPMTLDDYHHARMVRWPLCMLDMDMAVDGADAFVITTAERARDLALPPVLVHAAAQGMVAQNEEDQSPSLHDHGQHVVVETLRAASELWLDDVDVLLPYDGFSFIALSRIENLGWCAPGEGQAFLEANWDTDLAAIRIGGRVPVNPHGGALSEGATHGSGHVREAVLQLQGRAGARQVAAANNALVTTGGFFKNAQGCILRTAGA